MSTEQITPAASFAELGLPKLLLATLDKLGYEQPSPIQARTIPLLNGGRDVLGMAQTGTGKTAAFALPIVAKINLKHTAPQALVLAPTRELAIQVAEAFGQYAAGLKGFHVLPIYGGQDYRTQLRGLKRGPQVVVGTPGRIIDHLKRGSLSLDSLRTLVLDEADEMLRMGFIDDIEWILDQAPEQRQLVLFSATMPKEIRRVADRYLSDGEEVRIEAQTRTAANIEQSYWFVRGIHKLDALTRMLEVEDYDGLLIFVRTKTATQELADRLEARGHSAAAINGDMNQASRERVIDKLKKGQVDIVVATDVAARGIDVDRISHVINYDIPYDNESYVHRIGRTGRAGRSGKAILFVAPREKHLLRNIERSTGQPITEMMLPGGKEVSERRIRRFIEQVTEVIAERDDLDYFADLLRGVVDENEFTLSQVAAALAYLHQQDRPLRVRDAPAPRDPKPGRNRPKDGPKGGSDKHRDRRTDDRTPRGKKPLSIPRELYRLEVGEKHGAKVGEIVGAVANEAGLDNEFIGRIKIYDDHSTIELPEGMPKDIFQHLKRVRVRQQPLKLRHLGAVEQSKPRNGGPPRKGPGTVKKRKADGPRNHKHKSRKRGQK